MLVAARLLPAAARFARQIVPPVVATLIAAFLIAAYNKTFSSHLSQPRFSGLQAEASAILPVAPPAIPAVAKAAEPATEVVTIHEFVDEPERLADKDAGQEAGKDQAAIKTAAEPAPPRPTPAPRAEPRRVASLEQPPVTAAPVIAPAPVIVAIPVAPAAAAPVAHEPPPVIVAAPPIVTVPDRSSARPTEDAQVPPAPPPQGALGRIVNTLKPSNWFARAREFGERIEQAGNDILPSIRQ